MSSSKHSAPRAWPRKSRELQNWICDSTRWNDFEFRRDDIVISTWSKAGTTWLQQIVGQLLFPGVLDLPVMDLAPWVDMRVIPKEEIVRALGAQTHRRFMKTHLPVDALVFSPEAKYIYAARDGRDVLLSWYHHHASFSQEAYDMINNTPGLVGPTLERPTADIRAYFHEWLDRDGFPVWSFWQHVQSWWDIRELDNVLLVHFASLKQDLAQEMRRIAEFLGIEVDAELWPSMVHHCTFEHMKRNAEALSPMLGAVFDGGAQSFVNKGTNGRWRDVLTSADIEKYERIANANLTPDCARWLATGEAPSG
jgi:aryl sulfotransferase